MPEIFKWAVLWTLVILVAFIFKTEGDAVSGALAVELEDGSTWMCERKEDD